MDVFPETPVPTYSFVISPVWKTEIGTFENGGEQRRSKWVFPKYNVSLKLTSLSPANSNVIWEFYMKMRGAFSSFYFFDRYSYGHFNLFICTTDGINGTYDIPGKSTSSQTIYENGTEKTSGFTIDIGGGDGGSDRIIFDSVPPEGVIYSLDFTGFLRIKCRFLQDNLNRETFAATLVRYGIELKGL